MIITHSYLIFLIIYKCLLRKLIKKKEINIERNALKDGKKKGKELELIFNESGKINVKNPLILISMILLEFIYDTCLLIYQKIEED